MIDEEREEKRALLVSVYMGSKMLETCRDHLDELEFLCDTYGLEVVSKIPCAIRKFDASTFITSGKLRQLGDGACRSGADIVVFDDEISPAQQRNLEKFLNLPVIDRTEIILGVFAERAHTREAKLQIELAELQYQAPRLKRMWTHLSRQQATSGGGAYLKGKGEKQIEIDRRLLKDRMHKLKKRLAEIEEHRDTLRVLRKKSGIPVFACVGYTNAGKSTLLNALTDAGIFVEDKLFATLDTTTRKFTLNNRQEILLIDTVGFIRKLPHLLVAAFRSTLEEAVQADFLLHIIDVSHPMAEEQSEATFEVLRELEAEDKPIITVLNKIDLCRDNLMINRMRLKYSKTVQISALRKDGLDRLLGMIVKELSKLRSRLTLRIPQSDYREVCGLMKNGRILNKEYFGNDLLLEAEVPAEMVGRLKKYIRSD